MEDDSVYQMTNDRPEVPETKGLGKLTAANTTIEARYY